jgi:tRNA(Ile)-lysidine synthase
VPREALRAYASAHALSWCEDPSNAVAHADRNFLRLRVLPLMVERWPSAAASLATSAALLEEDARLLDEATDERLRALGAGETLPVAGLLALSDAWRARVLRRWVLDRGLPPLPAGATAAITRDLLEAPHDRLASYRWRDADLRRWRGNLHALRTADLEPFPAWTVAWSGLEPLDLPDGGTLAFEGESAADLQAEFGACSVGSRHGGERLRLPGRSHSHSLKQQLQAAGLPPWVRLRLPLLRAADGELLAAGDAFVSQRLQAWCERRSLALRWRRPGLD